MPEAKGRRETETSASSPGLERPLALDELLRAFDDVLGLLVAKASYHADAVDDDSLPLAALEAARSLVALRREDIEKGSAPPTPAESSARIESAWRHAMIEAKGLAPRAARPRDAEPGGGEAALAALAEEMATYRARLPELLAEGEGRFVLIKGREVVGMFPDRSAALREGYRRFGVVPFLAREVTAAEPAVYLPNVVP